MATITVKAEPLPLVGEPWATRTYENGRLLSTTVGTYLGTTADSLTAPDGTVLTVWHEGEETAFRDADTVVTRADGSVIRPGFSGNPIQSVTFDV